MYVLQEMIQRSAEASRVNPMQQFQVVGPLNRFALNIIIPGAHVGGFQRQTQLLFALPQRLSRRPALGDQSCQE